MERLFTKHGYPIEEEISNQLSIVKVAEEIMGEPAERRDKTVKWNVVYFTIYGDEKTPSFKISERLNVFHCFSSGKTGNVVKLYQDFRKFKQNESLSIEEACKELIEKFELDINIDHKKELSSYDYNERKIIDFLNLLMNTETVYLLYDKKAEKARQYLKERQIEEDTIRRFRLAYCDLQEHIDRIIEKSGIDNGLLKAMGILTEEDTFSLLNRILIPIVDKRGNVLSIIGRSLDNNADAKYKQLNINLSSLNSREFKANSHLYNYEMAEKYIQMHSEIIMVEGYFDVMRLYQLDVKNVVASQTTSLTPEQKIRLSNLKISTITVCLDGDEAGVNGSYNMLKYFSHLTTKKQVFLFDKVYQLCPNNYLNSKSDPDTYFINKNNNDWKCFYEKRQDYRTIEIETVIEEYWKNQINLEDLYNTIGDFINLTNPSYITKLEQIILNDQNKLSDKENFEKYFKYPNEIQSLYLMRRLDAEREYCIELLNASEEFVNRFRVFSDFMNKVYILLITDYFDKDCVKYYKSIENRKLFGSKSTKLVIDIYDENHIKIYSMELDYLNNNFLFYNRFYRDRIRLGEMHFRNDKNFFDTKLYSKVDNEHTQNCIMEQIKRVFNENIAIVESGERNG